MPDADAFGHADRFAHGFTDADCITHGFADAFTDADLAVHVPDAHTFGDAWRDADSISDPVQRADAFADAEQPDLP
jgi:hypothetical protein